MKKAILILIVIIAGLACKKSEDTTAPANNNPAPQPTKKELLTAKPWKYFAWTVNPAVKDSLGNDVTDVYNFKPACDRDDILIFHTNGNLDFDQGVTKCDPNSDQTTTNVWFFNTAETTLTLGSNVYLLDKLTTDTLILSFDQVLTVTHHHIITFVH